MLMAVETISVRSVRAEASIENAQRLLVEKGRELQDNDLKIIGQASELTSLDLTQCGRISDKGLEHLSGLTSLKTLNLTGCRKISAAGLKHLQNLTSLESLSLEAIGPALNGLSSLKELPKLRSLDVSDNNCPRFQP